MIINLLPFNLFQTLNVSDETILDFTGTLPDTSQVLQARLLDEGHQIEKRGLTNYIRFCEELSHSRFGKRSVRSYGVSGLSLYWLAPIAVKHPNMHWGKMIFFLRQFLMERKQLFEAEPLTIYLPLRAKHALDVLRPELERLSKCWKIEFAGTVLSTSSFALFKHILRFAVTSVSFLIYKKRNRGNTRPPSEISNIFITNYFGTRDAMTLDKDIGGAYKLAKDRNAALALYVAKPDKSVFELSDVDRDYITSYPTFSQLIALCFGLIWNYINISLVSRKVKVTEHCYESGFLKKEMKLALYQTSEFLNYLWLKNYFRQITRPVKVFYTDEFYARGRAISAAAVSSQNKNIYTVGVQHGLFFPNHTVYVITDKELQSDAYGTKGIPIPNKFVVWGEYFKDLFLKNNSLETDYVEVVGNVEYMDIPTGTATPSKKPLKILWCTTLLSHFKAEYHILRDVLKRHSSDIQLKFRLHPRNHMTQEDIRNIVDESLIGEYSFQNAATIFEDIAANDLIICTGSSTVFFDSLIMKKATCRVVSNTAIDDFADLKAESLYHIRATADFEIVLDHISPMNRLENIDFIEGLCYLKTDRWLTILDYNSTLD